jgi:hypothetical protein
MENLLPSGLICFQRGKLGGHDVIHSFPVGTLVYEFKPIGGHFYTLGD